MKILPFQQLDPIPPQIADDPKDANFAALKYHNPVIGIYATGKDIDTGEDMVAEIVDGPWIRVNVFQDFTEGGNHERYPWCPNNHYWIDTCNINEADETLGHETLEDLEMRDKHLTYGNAHSKFANSVEFELRHHPEKRVEILRMLGWNV